MGDGFQTTRWSVVLAAVDQDARRQDALAWLCEAYWSPLYAFVRRRGLDSDRARDVVQSFFLRLLDGDGLRTVDRSAGKFRAFLLASMKHFLSNERARERAMKRRADDPAFSVSLDGAEEVYRRQATRDESPEEAFERRWALTVFERALARLESEYREAGRVAWFDHLRGHLTGTGDTSIRDVAARLESSEGSVKTALHRMRKRLGRVMREEVSATLPDDGDVDEEIRYLLRVLG